MSSEILKVLAGMILVIAGALMIYDLKNAPVINDDHEREPRKPESSEEPTGSTYRPGQGGVL